MKNSSNPLRTRLWSGVLGIVLLGQTFEGATQPSADGPPLQQTPTFSDANWISMGGIPGVGAGVKATVVDDSGNLYIGGFFTIAGDIFATRIAKWDGSRWSPLGSGIEGVSLGIDGSTAPSVRALAVSGTNLYAAGDFTIAGGTAANRIARWDGSRWWALGSGMNHVVHALAVSGSDLYAAGYFTNAGGIAVNSIAKWDGTSWSALSSGLESTLGYIAQVYALAVSGTDVYAGGVFWTAGGNVSPYIAKWNGNNWSALGSGLNGWVYALAVSGGDLYVGGRYFTMAGGQPATNIAKWNGSSWSAVGLGVNFFVHALAASGTNLYAGGEFTTAGGSQANYIAKWNGSSWSALDSGLSNTAYALAAAGSNIYAGGSFTYAGGGPATLIAKWNGSSWSALGSGLDHWISALALSGSNIYAGGYFSKEGRFIAKWNDGGWSTLGSGMNSPVHALAVSDSDVYAGGQFTTAGDTTVNYIARWNGSNWSSLGGGMGRTDGRTPIVYALTFSGSNLYAGGNFWTAGGIAATAIAKWNGSSWSALDLGIGGEVYALAVSGNDLYAGGSFTRAGSTPATNVAKWNGTSWSALGSGPSSVVRALAVMGNELYAGGEFVRVGGTTAFRIAKWNGSSWSALGSGIAGIAGLEYPYVYALAVSGGDLYAGGWFKAAGGTSANYIAKWNGSSWSALGSGLNSTVYALVVSGNDLFVGGGFKTAGGKVSGYAARAALGNAPGYNQLTSTPWFEGTMRFSYVGYPDTNYALDRASDLSPPITWIGQETNAMTVSGVLMFTNAPAPGTNNFWRVRSVP